MNKGSPSWLLIGGCPRSGTTLLNLVVNTHNKIRITNEHCIWTLLDKCKTVFQKEELLRSLPERKKRPKEIWTNDTLVESTLRYDVSVRPMLEAAYKASLSTGLDSIKWFGDKFPMYYKYDLDKLQQALGDIRIIHISRRPIDTIHSMMWRANRTKEGNDNWKGAFDIIEAGNEWIRAWDFVSNIVIKNGFCKNRVMHIKYDDLLLNKKKTLSDIAIFLDVEDKFDDSIINMETSNDLTELSTHERAAINKRFKCIETIWSEPLESISRNAHSLSEIAPNPGGVKGFVQRLFG